MNTFSPKNFYKQTYCLFKEVTDQTELKFTYKSRSSSQYLYTEKGVYRYANHWGRVAQCKWPIQTLNSFKNQQYYVGFALWSDFFSLQATDKLFSIVVNFSQQNSCILKSETTHGGPLYSISEALLKQKEIAKMFKNTRWCAYAEADAAELTQKAITAYLNSSDSLNEIKRAIRASALS